ncbi:hypothetical protein SAMN05216315_108103 [Nitrosospira sp. Nsp18]|nr:hypothetical protein SAMN05216315_108103 [Nitrosospira sp. Nsp18]
MMWDAFKSCAGVAALRNGMRERRRREWCDRSGDGTFPRKVRRQSGILAPEARPRYSRHCRIAAPRYPSHNTLGRLPFAARSTKRVARKAAIPSLHWHMSGKIGHSCRCPSWHVGQTKTFSARLVITPIFATRSTGELLEGSLKRSDITC